MKVICCDSCQAFIPLNYDWQACECEAIRGRYEKDGRHVKVVTRNKRRTRVIGVENCVRYGMKVRGDSWKIKWDDKRLEVVDESEKSI